MHPELHFSSMEEHSHSCHQHSYSFLQHLCPNFTEQPTQHRNWGHHIECSPSHPVACYKWTSWWWRVTFEKTLLSNSHLALFYPFNKFIISAIIFSDVRFLYTSFSYKIIKKSLTGHLLHLLYRVCQGEVLPLPPMQFVLLFCSPITPTCQQTAPKENINYSGLL